MENECLDCIDLYLFDINQLKLETIRNYSYLISDYRLRKAGTLVREQDQKRCVAAGMLANFCLRKRAGNQIYSLKIHRNKFGKPSLENNPFYFNLSHSGRWAVCALSDYPVGVDIEKIKDIHPGMYEHCLSHVEFRKLPSGKEDADMFFIKLWTMKESFSKMRGDGLYCGINHFTAFPDLEESEEFPNWKEYTIRDDKNFSLVGIVQNRVIGKDYSISICWPYSVARKPNKIRTYMLNLFDIYGWLDEKDVVCLL